MYSFMKCLYTHARLSFKSSEESSFYFWKNVDIIYSSNIPFKKYLPIHYSSMGSPDKKLFEGYVGNDVSKDIMYLFTSVEL